MDAEFSVRKGPFPETRGQAAELARWRWLWPEDRPRGESQDALDRAQEPGRDAELAPGKRQPVQGDR